MGVTDQAPVAGAAAGGAVRFDAGAGRDYTHGMFIPIGDTPNPRNYTPWMTYGLMLANVAVYLFVSLPLSGRPPDPNNPLLQEYLRFLAPSLPPGTSLRQVVAQLSAYDLFTFAHGYKPGAPEVSDLLFSLFLHGGLLHLAGNMLFLWIFGDNVEHRLGRVGFVLVYLASGVVATLAFALLAGDSLRPLVGASGAISGVLGLYFLLFPRNQVRVLIFLFFIFDIWLLPARWVLGFYVIIDNLLPLLLGSETSVAYGAHLGGFAAGLAVAGLGERLGWRWPWSQQGRMRLGGRSRRSRRDGLEAVRRALDAAEPERARLALEQLPPSRVAELEPEECAVLADWLQAAGHEAAASSLLRRCLASHPRSDRLARVYLAQHLLSALDHDPDPITANRARAALGRIERRRR
jgi:membrane associated rhomboid family serine protease